MDWWQACICSCQGSAMACDSATSAAAAAEGSGTADSGQSTYRSGAPGALPRRAARQISAGWVQRLPGLSRRVQRRPKRQFRGARRHAAPLVRAPTTTANIRAWPGIGCDVMHAHKRNGLKNDRRRAHPRAEPRARPSYAATLARRMCPGDALPRRMCHSTLVRTLSPASPLS